MSLDNTIKEIKSLAEENGFKPSQMALSYVNSRPFLTSNIVGATNLKQLKENIDSVDIKLNEKIIEKIEEIHKINPNPAP